MFNRFLIGTAGIVAAVAGPAALFTANDHLHGGGAPTTATETVAAPMTPGGPVADSSPAVLSPMPGSAPAVGTPPLSALAAASIGTNSDSLRVPTVSMAEAFNMDATPEWVASRWPRVSNGLAQLNLHGYRVPLVTGTSMLDVAGSLTYYFNPLQRVERITFQGTTGDPRNLVGLLAQRFQFGRRLTNDPGLIVYESPHGYEPPLSWLRIRPAGILQSNDPYHRFDVELVLQRPQS